jgi:peptide/nickel transport system ATP-binding protein
MALLELDQLRIELPTPQGPAEALRGVSWQLEAGATLGLIGESGCGKSLTALAIMGLAPRSAWLAGSVRFEGQELVGLAEREHARLRGRRMAMVFQEPMTALNPLHTLAQQIGEPLRLHRGLSNASARAEAPRLLERVHLPQARARLDAYPHQLSGGQRQRVVIAIALACRPALLLADEPTTALDATVQREVLALLMQLVHEDGMALVLISHDLAVMAETVQRVAVMYAGQVVEHGPTATVLREPAHPYTRGLLAARPRLGLARGTRLANIPGQVPALGAMPPGCAFAPRCTLALPACTQAAPAAIAVADGHAARCIRIGEQAWTAA